MECEDREATVNSRLFSSFFCCGLLVKKRQKEQMDGDGANGERECDRGG